MAATVMIEPCLAIVLIGIFPVPNTTALLVVEVGSKKANETATVLGMHK